MYPLLTRNSTAPTAYDGHMRSVPRDPPPSPWRRLLEALAGFFSARARGFLASEFILLNQGGGEFGSLRIHGTIGAELEAEDLRAAIERAPHGRHRMLSGDEETLVAEPLGSADILEIRCGGRRYESQLSLLRNTAVARSSGDEEAARVTGGLTNRAYKAVFDAEDEGSLPVAIFLLYYTIALRSRAYRTGAEGE
jgi:hypothetical protein